jgi:N-acetylglutamate synthase-like GNAT family acetyltransferase
MNDSTLPENIRIVDYTPEYQKAFRDLNVAWIEEYFVMEEEDYKALDHPDEKILKPGGHILIALSGEEVVGTCALIPMDDEIFELAKMAVAQQHRGKNIGWMLGQATLQKAKELGARKVYLETNSRLTPAISLYEKLGFQHVSGHESPYARADVQMEIHLSEE